MTFEAISLCFLFIAAAIVVPLVLCESGRREALFYGAVMAAAVAFMVLL